MLSAHTSAAGEEDGAAASDSRVHVGRAALMVSVGCYYKRMGDILIKWEELCTEAKNSKSEIEHTNHLRCLGRTIFMFS